MIVSKAFWKIVLKNIGSIISPTIVLLMFGTISATSTSSTMTYEARKPAIVIFNHDEEVGMTKSFISYIDKNAEIKTDYEDDDRLKDALFYENVAAVVEIPENFHQDIALGHRPEVKMRSSAGYVAEVAKVMIRRYLTVAEGYAATNLSEQALVERVDNAVIDDVETEMQAPVDTSKFAKASRYYSFANYTILSCFITIICLIMSAFNRTELRKRNLVGAIDIRKMNLILLKNCCLYALAAWAFYVTVSVFVLGTDVMFTTQGLLYAANSFVFAVMATTVAYLISLFGLTAGAVNGVQNVLALSSSFLCGAFVPIEYMPESVVLFAHALPSYYYIDANDKIMNLPDYSFENLLPILLEMAVVAGFAILFVIVANIISKKRRKIA